MSVSAVMQALAMPSVLEGDRVRLQAFGHADITPEYVDWLSDPQVVQYSNQRFVRHTEESCRRYLDSFANTANLFISIRRQADGAAVGTMTAYVSSRHGTADIGIMVGRRDAWGQGIGLDAWRTLLEWLLRQPGMRKVTAGTMRCNVGMVRVMERSGMEMEAVRVGQELLDGVAHDLLYYARFRDR
ncbi:GNAT family N-acetyltransferase [Herbaspirillum chlorophenolicum]|uniref:GNAT family N-acetyltransferase n=1 Tax=Herbaspirillum chlorophenolicum TaxID=211589 RepID=A0ABW8EUV2_9BURK